MSTEYQLPHMGGATISAKLTARLIRELRSGMFATAERLPAEVELAEKFGVSRSVIRDVMANLEREGFVERGRGIGTRIHRDIVALNNRLDLKFEYYELVRGTGCTPSADSVKLALRPAGAALAARLEIQPEDAVIVCEKRVLASGRPVIFSVDSLPHSIFAGMDWQALDWSLPVFDLLEEHCGIAVDTDIANVTAALGPPAVREKLAMAEGEALLQIDEVGYYKLSRPILQTYGYYTNFFDFTMLRRKF